MGFRFRKSFKIAPGIKLNVGKKGIGISAGTKGARVSVNSSGRVTKSVGIPGTGVSYVKSEKIGKKQSKAKASSEPSPETASHSSEFTTRPDLPPAKPQPDKSGKGKNNGCGCLSFFVVILLFLFLFNGCLGSCSNDTEESDTTSSAASSTTSSANSAASAPAVAVESLEAANPLVTSLTVGQTAYSDHLVLPPEAENVDSNYFTVTSSDPNVLTVSAQTVANPLRVYVEFVGVAPGTATYTITAPDGTVMLSSDAITVSAPPEPEPVPAAEPETSGGQTVYITPSGERYHLDPDCGGKNSYPVDISEVGGRTPCKKCAGG